jgi:excinuclease ABC subunit B
MREVDYKEEQKKRAGFLRDDPVVSVMSKEQLERMIASAKANMEQAAAELNFMQAAAYRDEMNALKELLGKK